MSERDRKYPFGISLDEELAERLRVVARLSGVSVSRLVRDVMRAHCGEPGDLQLRKW